MKRIRIRMLASIDQLYAGTEYNVPEDMARDFASRGKAVVVGEEAPRALPTFETRIAEPTETKPVTSVQIKKKVKRNA